MAEKIKVELSEEDIRRIAEKMVVRDLVVSLEESDTEAERLQEIDEIGPVGRVIYETWAASLEETVDTLLAFKRHITILAFRRKAELKAAEGAVEPVIQTPS